MSANLALPRIAFKTFGCKANSVDTDVLYLEATRRGYQVVSDEEAADAYVINSCTVTSHADRDARWQVSKFKRLNPQALVGVVGCYAQVAKQELLNLADVDYVVGTANKLQILDYFSIHLTGKKLDRDQVSDTSGFLPEIFRGSRYARATVKVQDGCNFKCSFCIIPEARGRSRSLTVESVVNQIHQAQAQGFEEIILTGIHLAHYGWDHGTDLLQLLRTILKDQKGPRIRLSTLDPFEIPDELIALVATEKRLCPHYHIALQSGSDRILQAMRRIYKAQEFVDATRKIYQADPNTFVGVDVIVGFPGESDVEFAETVDCLKASVWSKLHVFPFSVRRGTKAETLENHVNGKVIAERSRILRELSDKRYALFLKTQLGKSKQVVLEKPSPRDPQLWFGHTENYLPTVGRFQHPETKRTLAAKITASEKERVWVEVAL